VEIFDGVHLDYQNLDSLREACVAGREMGFDGKTLIHPDQVRVANEVFGVSIEDYERANQVLEVWDSALKEGKGVAVLDGQLIENLHADESRRIVSLYEELKKRGE
jgi:citrate lyase subunit beta/citryl-CoA lyase